MSKGDMNNSNILVSINEDGFVQVNFKGKQMKLVAAGMVQVLTSIPELLETMDVMFNNLEEVHKCSDKYVAKNGETIEDARKRVLGDLPAEEADIPEQFKRVLKGQEDE